MLKCVCGNARYLICPAHPPTAFVRGRHCGKFLYIIAKLEAGWPLSAVDRDIVLEAVRRQWLTAKDHNAFMRQRELHQIEATKRIAAHFDVYMDADKVNQQITGRSKKALKQFAKRERKKRR